MSHPLKVPLGWTKGMPLQVMGTGPRYGLMRSETAFEAFQRMQEDPRGFIEDVYVTFDSKSDLEAFLDWWKSDNGEAARD